jgi:uncharacterized protein (DUF2062 family)
MFDKIKTTFDSLIKEFTSINDTPHRIALSFALGVFLGILPFTGVLAAIGIAWYFRLNKPAAILGSLITNTWVGFIVLGLSIKSSGVLLGVSSNEVSQRFHAIFKPFQWSNLFHPSVLEVLGAIILGFILLSLLLSVLAYFLCLVLVYWQRRAR